MREDLIDFPVSDTWRDYYYEIGLTPYPSPRYYERQNEELQGLRQEIARLNDILAPLLKRRPQSEKPVKTQVTRPTKRSRKTWPVDTE